MARFPGLPDGTHVAVCRFAPLTAIYFGPPNNEALENHPLYGRGLGFYGVFRVEASSWVASITELASRNDRPRRPDTTRRHWIVTTEDSTFECIAQSMSVVVHSGSMQDALIAIESS